MTETIEEPKSLEAPPVVHPSSRTTFFMTLIALIVGLSALLVAGYLVYRYWQNTQHFHRQEQRILAQINHLKKREIANKKIILQRLASARKNEKKIRNSYLQLEKNINNTLAQQFYQTQDWLLLKARYYLELAQINNQWSANSETSIALLETADSILAGINDPGLFTVRQAISNEITSLKAIPVLDMPALLIRLDNIQNTLKNLPLKSANPDPMDDSSNSSNSGWRTQLNKSLKQLQKLVIIRHHSEEVEPLITLEQSALLREKIQFKLQTIEWAILQREDQIFQSTLIQVIENLQQYFQSENAAPLIQELNELKKIQLESQTPELTQSLNLLNQYIQSKKSSNQDQAIKIPGSMP